MYAQIGTTLSALEHQAFLRPDTVDRICCALGVHPSHVYGDALEEAAS